MKTRILFLAENLALTLIYFACGKFGLSLAFVNASATAVWPPSGVALAALLIRGNRLWPGVALGAFLVNITTQGSFATSLGIALGNTLEAVLGAWLVCRFAKGVEAFERTKTIFRFVLLAALASTLVSAFFGVTSLCLGGLAHWDQYFPIWFTWWLGDMVSEVVITPLTVVWLIKPSPRVSRSQIGEGTCLLAVIIWLGEIVFFGNTRLGRHNLPLEYLAIPPLLFAAFRFGRRGALSSTFLMSALALWGTLHNHGPFARPNPNESLLLLQAFMGTITLMTLVLASIVLERKRTEAELNEAREQLRKHALELEARVSERTAKLEETVDSLESLCYTIAHDLRAPLRAMSGYSDVLAEEYGAILDRPGKDYATHIKSAAGRMDQLILDLLKLGRLGSAEMSPANVELDEVTHKALAPLEEEIKSKRAQIRIQKPLLPLWANDAMVEQVLLNLFANALKFTKTGTEPIIDFWTEDRNGWVRVCVRDNGIGIKSEHLHLLFQPFEKLVLGDQNTGTGMGLAIVRKGVERMGGRVGVQSDNGQGSCFWIELPGVRTDGEI